MNEPVDRTVADVEPVAVPLISEEEKTTTVEVDPTPADSINTQSAKVRVEEFRVSGDALVAKVKELLHQGNIRRIIIKNEEERTLVEVPLTVGVVGGVIGASLFPIIAALGAIGALVAHLTIVIERKEE